MSIENPSNSAPDGGVRRGTPRWRVTERLLPSNPSQVAAYLRLALTGFALSVTYLDPIRPNHYNDFASSVISGYAAYAAVIAIAVNFEAPESKGPFLRHIVDLLVCVVLTFLTQGPTSPSFAFFAFALVSGALHWGARGAIGTAIIILALYLAVRHPYVAASDGVDLKHLIILAPYLMIAGLLFGYLGTYRERNRERLAMLAAWPQVEGSADRLSLSPLMRHAAFFLGLDHLVVIWEDVSEPGWRVSHFNSRDGETTTRRGPIKGDLVADSLAGIAFMATDPAGSHVLTSEGIHQVQAPIVTPGVFNLPQIRSFSSAPFESTHFRGRVFILDRRAPNGELLSLTEIIAGRIGVELEHFGLRVELEATAAARERMRVARDMHDGILQDFTAANITMTAMCAAAPAQSQQLVGEILKVFAIQQRRIREFVTAMNPNPERSESVPLRTAIRPIVGELAERWRCGISVEIRPEDARLRSKNLPQIRFILAEAVANAVRHGKATKIDVAIELDPGLWIEIRDNGSMEVELTGPSTGPIAPFSLRQRVRDMGGGCNLTIGANGGTLVIALPAG